MLEEKIRDVFADMVVLKNPERAEFFKNLSLPSYMRDWLVMKFSDEDGGIDYDSVLRYIRQYIPSREDYEQFKFEMVNGETVRFLARVRVVVDIKTGKTMFELPDFGGTKAGAAGEVANDVVSRWKDTLLKESENWGIIELIWGKDFTSSKAKGVVKLIEYSPFCPYTVDLDYYKDARNSFTTEEWIDLLIAAADYNPEGYESEAQKLCFLRRLLPFVEKRDMEKGFNDSAFRLNNDVKTCDKWTEDELIQRQGTLFNVALRLWPMPTTSFKPVERELETASLDDEDFEFTGKKLQAYSYKGIRYPVSTWKDMLINVCMLVLLEHRATFEWMSANEKCHIAKEDADWRTEITDNFYVWTANSTITKIGILRSIFDECGVSGSELVFEFRPESQESDD